jgi:hypothetical protein
MHNEASSADGVTETFKPDTVPLGVHLSQFNFRDLDSAADEIPFLLSTRPEDTSTTGGTLRAWASQVGLPDYAVASNGSRDYDKFAHGDDFQRVCCAQTLFLKPASEGYSCEDFHHSMRALSLFAPLRRLCLALLYGMHRRYPPPSSLWLSGVDAHLVILRNSSAHPTAPTRANAPTHTHPPTRTHARHNCTHTIKVSKSESAIESAGIDTTQNERPVSGRTYDKMDPWATWQLTSRGASALTSMKPNTGVWRVIRSTSLPQPPL